MTSATMRHEFLDELDTVVEDTGKLLKPWPRQAATRPRPCARRSGLLLNRRA